MDIADERGGDFDASVVDLRRDSELEDDLVCWREIHELLLGTLPLFTVRTERGQFPYQIVDNKPIELPRSYSESTNAMISHSLLAIMGLLPDSQLANCPVPDRDGIVTDPLRRDLDAVTRRLVEEVRDDISPSGEVKTRSRTFGPDDPFTLTWLVELLRMTRSPSGGGPPEGVEQALAAVTRAARARVTQALSDPTQPVLQSSSSEDGEEREGRKDRFRPLYHIFPLLRVAYLASLLAEQEPDRRLDHLGEHFATCLHRQLSFVGIADSAYDVAEMAWALEGVVLFAPRSISRSVLVAVERALQRTAKLNPALRPATPFKVDERGAVQLFVSVEVAASLLRSAALLEKSNPEYRFFKSIKPTLRRYLQWLQASLLDGRAAGLQEPERLGNDRFPETTVLQYSGWQSEHSHTGDRTVHTWHTSQVVLFLRGYSILLERDIAERSRKEVGLSPRATSTWNPPAAETPEQRALRWQRDDPLQGQQHSVYRVASDIEMSFIAPRRDGRGDPCFSCLLYGPPGTGKTSLAERLAAELRWPLITITTSDFILDGEARVEARAKSIFEALSRQSNLVVFFDEIDRLLLDRDGPDYQRQGDMLQFMTPSMLTKINDLRAAGRLVTVIGTNYADRIDGAIKRDGRIDRKYLVLPPDLLRRKQIIESALDEVGRRRNLPDDTIRDAAVAGVWRTAAQLRAAVMRASARVSLADAVRLYPSSITLSSYRARAMRRGLVLDGSDNQTTDDAPPRELLEEAFLLCYLWAEGRTGSDRLHPDGRWLIKAWARRPEATIRDPLIEQTLGDLLQ
jgi:hypothetical protein